MTMTWNSIVQAFIAEGPIAKSAMRHASASASFWGLTPLGIAGLVVALGAVVTSVILLLRARQSLVLQHQPHALHFAETADGWRLALHRYVPTSTRPAELPVVLCHGLSANRFNLDFDEQRSLARYLCRRGYDVWVVELRGAGMSHPVKPQALRAYSFDDYMMQDLPAAFEYILRATRAPKVNYAGHSMGGMLMYCGLPRGLERFVHATVAIGAPATFAFQKKLRVFLPLLALLSLLPRSLMRGSMRLFAPFVGRFRVPLTRGFGTLAPVVQRTAVYNVVEPAHRMVMAQFMSWMWRHGGALFSANRQVNYEATFGRITSPMLLIAGESDLLAPPASVRFFFERIQSDEREFVVCSKENGFSEDYGHIDLILGDRAADEVFTLVEGFLWKHRHGELIELSEEHQRKRA